MVIARHLQLMNGLFNSHWLFFFCSCKYHHSEIILLLCLHMLTYSNRDCKHLMHWQRLALFSHFQQPQASTTLSFFLLLFLLIFRTRHQSNEPSLSRSVQKTAPICFCIAPSIKGQFCFAPELIAG